jgi:X-Pro dipeptidyl-peptidase
VLGVENGVEDDARAWIVREGDDRLEPTAYEDWPVPGAQPVTLFPGPGGAGQGTLGPSAGTEEVHESFVDDVTFTGSQLARSESSPNRLLYQTEELARPLHLSGTPEVTIRLAADREAVNLTVWLVALPWEEAAPRQPNFSVITRGWADPQNHRSLTESDPLVPGTFRDVTFTLQPDDQVVPAGKRIALVVFSSDREYTLWPEPGAGLTLDLAGTSLTLPVVGGEVALAEALGSGG